MLRCVSGQALRSGAQLAWLSHKSWQSSSQWRAKTTLTTVKPNSDAPRLAPTPIVFASAWLLNRATPAKELWASFIADASANGFESLLLDLDPAIQPGSSSQLVMETLEKDMSLALRNAAAFPPILLCREEGSLVGEQYASSHALSALVLVDPPPSVLLLSEDARQNLSTPLEEFNFEPRFPCRVAWSQQRLESLEKIQADGQNPPLHRIENELIEEGEQEGRIVWSNADSEGPEEVRRWLEDECGILAQEDEVVSEEDRDGSLQDLAGVDDQETSADFNEPADGVEKAGFQRQMPEWFREGAYSFTTTGSKKMPLNLDEGHLREAFLRGSGKGGQAINKNRSRCDLLHIPTGLIVRCQDTRSLDQNREIARRRMSKMLDEKLRGNDSVRSKAAEKERKRKRNKLKKQAKARRGSEEGAEQGSPPASLSED